MRVFDAMKSMGFGAKWIKWMAVLVNGFPSKEFSICNGLRQGDPLSLLLFNLAGEVLSKKLLKAHSLGIFKGIELRKEGETLTYL